LRSFKILKCAIASISLSFTSCGDNTDRLDLRDQKQDSSAVTSEAENQEQLGMTAPTAGSLEGAFDSDPSNETDWVRGWATDFATVSNAAGLHYPINVDVRFRNTDGSVPAGCPDRLRIPASHSRPDLPLAKPQLKGDAVGFDLYVPVNCRTATSVMVHALSWASPDGVFRQIGFKTGFKFAPVSQLSPTTATLYAVHHIFEFGWFGLGTQDAKAMEDDRATTNSHLKYVSKIPQAFGAEENLMKPTPNPYAPGGRSITTMPANIWTGKAYPYCFMTLTNEHITGASPNSFYSRLNQPSFSDLRHHLSLYRNQCAFNKSNASEFETGLARLMGHYIPEAHALPHEQLIQFATQQARTLAAANIDVVILDNSNVAKYDPSKPELGDELTTHVPIDRFIEAMFHVHWRYRLCRDSNLPGNEAYRMWCDYGYSSKHFTNAPPKIAFLQSIGSAARPYLSDRIYDQYNSYARENIFFTHNNKKVIFYVEPDESDIHDNRRPDSFAIREMWDRGFLPVPMWTHVKGDGSINTSNETRTDFVGTCIKAKRQQLGDTRLYPTSSAAYEPDCILHIPKYTPLGVTAAIGPTYTVPGGLSSQRYANSGFNYGRTIAQMYRSALAANPNFLLIGSWNQHGAKQEFVFGGPIYYRSNLQGYRRESVDLLASLRLGDCGPISNYEGAQPLCNKEKEYRYKLSAKFHTAQWRGMPVGYGIIDNLKASEHHFVGKTYAQCAETLNATGAGLINHMDSCTQDLQNWLRKSMPSQTCYFSNGTPSRSDRNLFDCLLDKLMFGETSYVISSGSPNAEASYQFAHTYDTWTSEFSPDFEPSIASGVIRRDKFDTVTGIAGKFKSSSNRSFDISHAGYYPIRVATTIPNNSDQPGWFVYDANDPRAREIPGQPGLRSQLREICVNHDFQSVFCSDTPRARESRTNNGPFYLLINASPATHHHLQRCEKTSTPGFAYTDSASEPGTKACVPLGWMSKQRDVQNLRVVRRCEFGSPTRPSGQEFLAIDAKCPKDSSFERKILGFTH
jgi:hypothetical protein